MIAIVWNAPIAAMLVLLLRGVVTERTMGVVIAAWMFAIPLSCLVLLFAPRVRRLMFVTVNMTDLRPKLWSLAGLWLAIGLVWGISEWFRRG